MQTRGQSTDTEDMSDKSDAPEGPSEHRRRRSATRLWRGLAVGTLMVVLGACDAGPETDGAPWAAKIDRTEQFFEPADDVRLSRTQVLYVPVYSSILASEGERPTEMAATLALRNTDINSPIFVTKVAYYDTAGELIETFLDGLYGLGPLASASIIINLSDTRGGFGANFIVEWGAAEPISDPLVETVMIGSSGTKGFSFTSPARVIQSDER